IDVTYLATWQSSDDSVAQVDSWGTISALAIGQTTLTAAMGSITSASQPLSVVAQPTLQQIWVQNQSCFCGPVPVANPGADAMLPPCIFNRDPASDALPVPGCGTVLLVGATRQFTAQGQFADGSYADVSSAVKWEVAPPNVGSVSSGLFTAQAAGTAQVTASL